GPAEAHRREIDRTDTRVAQREELGGTAHPVLIRIAPHHELREGGILRVDAAVAVQVELRERAEPIFVLVPERRVAEELRRAVDDAVLVPVDREERVIAARPGGLHLLTRAEQVEGDAGVEAAQANAVAVEIEDQR